MDVFAGLPVEEDGDFIVNEKDHFICLTCEGVRKAEAFFHIENLSAPDQAEKQHTLLMALQANYLQKRNKDYVVKNVEATLKKLKELGIPVLAQDTGETFGRTITYYPETGELKVRAVGKSEKTI